MGMSSKTAIPTAEVFERYLIEHCSPTLASIKTGNLFTISYSDEENLNSQIAAWNAALNGKGISIVTLRRGSGRALIYVFRRSKLADDFKKSGVKGFLEKCGYRHTNVDYAVENLRIKLSENESFPHEIGLFLGYPLGDVIGFIVNEGKNCECTGFWKVYCNRCEAERTFDKFRKCNSVYCRLWQQGRSIQQLTVPN